MAGVTREGLLTPVNHCMRLLAESYLKKRKFMVHRKKTFDVIEVNEFDASGEHHHFILIAVLCRYKSGDAIASDDAIDCQWMPIEQIMSEQTTLIEHVGVVARCAAKLIAHNLFV